MADPILTTAQVEVLHLFFSLPESAGFVLAGGAGLVAAFGVEPAPMRERFRLWATKLTDRS